jgi:peptidoglycan/LPS O-acetylase OafA/YrhL
MGSSPAMVYICTPFRLDGLAAGSLLAILYRSECFNKFGFRMANWTALAIGTVGSVILLRPATEAGQNPLAFSASAVMFGGLLGITLTKAGDASLWAKLLKSPPLTQMGRLSYCIYLIHLPIFVFFQSKPLRRHLHLRAGIGTEVITLVAAFLLTILIASISWAAFESKFIGLRGRMSGLISNVRSRGVDAHA